MDTSNDDYRKLLEEYGINPDNLPAASQEDLLDIPRKSMERLVEKTVGDVRKIGSYGHVRLHGESVIGHSIALETAGHVLAFIQKAVTNFGAARLGNKTIRGAIPGSISQRTQLRLTAAPIPGSIVFTLAPETSGYTELYPQPALFENDNSPLADEAMAGILELLSSIDISTPDASDDFIAKLDELGPRFTHSFGELLGELATSHMNTEVEWSEPGRATQRIDLDYEVAGYARKLITEYKLDIEEMSVVGTIVTLTVSSAKKLDIELDNGDVISVEKGGISDAVIDSLHTHQRVELEIELSSGTKIGGKPVRNYKAISIKGLDDPDVTDQLF